MFSGGSYDEVARWLRNFLASHAKRVSPRLEVELDAGEEREGRTYGVRLRLAGRTGAPFVLDFREVADQRGSLAWCTGLAERTRGLARALVVERGTADAGAR